MGNTASEQDMSSVVRKKQPFDFVTSFLLSGAISFLFFISSPISVFIDNKTEFWFTFAQLLSVFIVGFLICFVVLGVIFLLLSKTRAGRYVHCFALSFLLYCYVQGDFIARDYGVFDGSPIEWDSYTDYALISILLIVLFLLLAISLLVFAKKNVCRVVRGVSICVLAVSVLTASILLITNRTVFNEQNKYVFTTDKLFEFSKNENVIVIILDTLETDVFEDSIDEYGTEVTDLFKDFTYYPDTVGCYPTTKGALPLIATGIWNDNSSTFDEYLNYSYSESECLSYLKDNNYEVGLYTRDDFICDSSADFSNVTNCSKTISNKFEFFIEYFRLVCFNRAPHQLKKYFVVTSDEFDKFCYLDSQHEMYLCDLHLNYERFLNSEIEFADSNNVFKIYHLEGIHPTFTFGKDLNTKYDATAVDEAMGNFTYLSYYFDMLKQNGIYDNATIIVMADHGHVVQLRQMPMFMIKNSGEEHDTLQMSDAAMSFDYLSDIFVTCASGETVDENYIESFNGAVNGRRYYYYSWDDSWDSDYLPDLSEYRFYDSKDISSAVFVEN